MILDWLVREGWIVLSWWFISGLMGLTALPALVRLLPALPDKGYTLARPAGLLLISFVFWFLATTGFINNSVGSIALSWVIVLALVGWVFVSRKDGFSWREWWADNRKLIVINELLFIVLLVGFAIFKAHQNEYVSTEKPMDLAFMAGILQSETFPPNDPWLSGYAISYYYFGYLMAAVNALLIGVPATIAYNMHLVLIFALTGTAVFGVVYNLIRAQQIRHNPLVKRIRVPVSFGLLGVFFLLMMSNLHMAIVELPYRAVSYDAEYYRFWDAKGRETMPLAEPVSLTDALQGKLSYWWWFSHARTITERSPDINLSAGDYYRGEILTEPLSITGTQVNEVIDEFPAFSFILGDSHPHVMTLPFVLLVLALALNIVLSFKTPDLWQTVFYGLCIGALVFLNTWDMPIYLVVIVGAEVIRRVSQNGWFGWLDFAYVISFAIVLSAVCVIAYSPFLVGFNSQAGGILPNVLYPTRPQQMFLMFGGFGLLLSGYIASQLYQAIKQKWMSWQIGVGMAVVILFVLILANVLLVAFGVIDGSYHGLRQDLTAGALGWDNLNAIVFGRRAETILTLIVLMAGLVFVLGRLFPQKMDMLDQETGQRNHPYTPANGFALLLILCGLGLILIPEFVYLRDNFGTRMNTIFKFYYQVWVLFSVSSAYGVYSIVTQADRPIAPVLRYGYSLIVVGVVLSGALYFPAGMMSRMVVETGIANNPEAVLTLDGGRGFMDAHDYQTVMCLQELVGRDQVVVAEATSIHSSYNSRYGRVGSLTGIPVVLGWRGHQSQWRGATYAQAVGNRLEDLNRLFTATTLTEVIPIIERYNIDYILYGVQEYQDYGGMGEYKFADHYEIVCETQTDYGQSRVYRVNRNLHPFITMN
jgi:YYY domain-containing protein